MHQPRLFGQLPHAPVSQQVRLQHSLDAVAYLLELFGGGHDRAVRDE
jgi:hypothetical protein